ncbi:hypothetical protein EK904_005736 [Melospiza melodia maxima]|nr:hypothetical protein EK904_005736 [Melospiza melodia maxima]
MDLSSNLDLYLEIAFPSAYHAPGIRWNPSLHTFVTKNKLFSKTNYNKSSKGKSACAIYLNPALKDLYWHGLLFK